MKNNDDMKVSVIIPTYNRAKEVTRAIDSVLSQTYTNHEIIVVDDGSTDNTKMVLQERYGNRINYIYQSNQRQAAARNTGIRASRYDLIAFLDSDDTWFPRKLELQLPPMSDPNIVLSYTNWINGDNDSGRDYFSQIGLKFDQEPAILEYPLRTLLRPNGSGILTTNCIARKQAIQRVGCFVETMKIAEDIRLWFRLSMEGKIAVISEPLSLRYWSNPGDQVTQLHNSSYLKEYGKERMEIFWEIYARAIDSPPDVQKMLRGFITRSLTDQAKYCALDGNYRMARRKAFESLAFLPKGRAALKAIVGLILPRAFRVLSKKPTIIDPPS